MEKVNSNKTSFTNDVLDSYEGAVVGPQGNERGKCLERYCKSIWAGKTSTPKVQFRTPQGVNELEDILSESETVIVNISTCDECPCALLENVFFTKKKNILVLFKSQKEQADMLKMLQSNEKSRSMILKELYFKMSPKMKGLYNDNLQFAILIGCLIHKPPLPVLNKSLSSVVGILTPPNSSVSFWSSGNLPFLPIHSEAYNVTYIGEIDNILKFKQDSVTMITAGEKAQAPVKEVHTIMDSTSEITDASSERSAANQLELETSTSSTTSPVKYLSMKRPHDSVTEDVVSATKANKTDFNSSGSSTTEDDTGISSTRILSIIS